MEFDSVQTVTGSEHQDAARIASGAGELLLELRRALRADDVDVKALRAAGDRQSHEFIVSEIARLYPDDGLLSEEGKDDAARLRKRRVWIVDPLDGTREFGELERTDWAVHVALTVDGVPVVAAVALPASGLTLSTATPPVLPRPAARPLRLVASRTRAPQLVAALAERFKAEVLPMGSAGAKTMAVVRGEADIYVHAGGQYEWDSAAPVGVAAAAGLHVSRIDGSPLRYNRPDPWLPDLLVCRPALAEDVLNALSQLISGMSGS